jgi:hypothetical protein
MENEININIINHIHNYVRNEPIINRYKRNLYNLESRPCLSLLDTWSSLPPLISHDKLVLSAFVEQEILNPDDHVCGITYEKPDCITSCGHHFCRAEITRWLEQQKKKLKKMTCPMCRAEITDVIPYNAKRRINLEDVD